MSVVDASVAPTATPLTAAQALEYLSTLDLTMIRLKLADPEEGQGWSIEQLDLAEREYRRFLALHLLHPDRAIVPCKLVDLVWHAHILDTMAYGPDCERLFGFFLHHFPYFGMRGEQDAADLRSTYDQTVELYRAAFGEPPAGVWRPEDKMKCNRTNCHPQKCR
ncbi:MAG: glycine-rich domain-containing protein [Frankiaceae bacterium]